MCFYDWQLDILGWEYFITILDWLTTPKKGQPGLLIFYFSPPFIIVANITNHGEVGICSGKAAKVESVLLTYPNIFDRPTVQTPIAAWCFTACSKAGDFSSCFFLKLHVHPL
jgi:hypothetical protein